MIRLIRIKELVVILVATLAPACLLAQETRPRSIVVLDQSELHGPFHNQVFSELRAVVTANAFTYDSIDALADMSDGRSVVGCTEGNGGTSALISISDSGPEIPAERLNRIFDPFFTTKEQGLGIGLSIARTIVLAHSGRIWGENKTAGGAVFRVTLPLSAH
jgi:nitrogen fixation/metabolism regulation signal transduction histidine kinase